MINELCGYFVILRSFHALKLFRILLAYVKALRVSDWLLHNSPKPPTTMHATPAPPATPPNLPNVTQSEAMFAARHQN